VTYRLLGSLATVGVALALTKDLSVSAVVGGMDLAVKVLCYYLHERLWELCPWGLTCAPHEQDAGRSSRMPASRAQPDEGDPRAN
jgi:uncharacterized membrane protein